jgi:hypothetical protein
MCSTTGSSDNYLQASIRSLPGKLCQQVRRTMRGNNFKFSLDPEFPEHFYRVAHRAPIGLAPHHDGDH